MLPGRIILIDDDRLCNFISERMASLHIGEIEIVSFENPEDGLAYLMDTYKQDQIPAMILLDINMPTLSGWDVLEEISTWSETVISCFTIFMLTSSLNPLDIRQARENKLVMELISKPITAKTLKQAHEIFTSRHHLQSVSAVCKRSINTNR